MVSKGEFRKETASFIGLWTDSIAESPTFEEAAALLLEAMGVSTRLGAPGRAMNRVSQIVR